MSYVAIDCEMVGGAGGRSMAARVSLVDENGQVLLDEYIKPEGQVFDYRTEVSGITPAHLNSAPSLATVRSRVANKIHGRYLVGHSLEYDLEALGLSHPVTMKRDLALHSPFINLNNGKTPSLAFLAKKLLGKTIQSGPHSSVEDARAAMEIFRKHWK